MYGQVLDEQSLAELHKKIEICIENQKFLCSGQTLYFGSVLPVYAYAEKSRAAMMKSTVCGIATIYGFEENQFKKIPHTCFTQHGIEEEEVAKFTYNGDIQFNSHLIGDDSQALRMAMTLMDEGESIETLKAIYDLIHAPISEGFGSNWETIITYAPALKSRYEKKHSNRFISEKIFGEVNDEYEQLVQRIRIKSFDRIPENSNKNSFDYIQIEVLLSGTIPHETKKFLCRKYLRAIGRHVLMVLEESRRFQRFSVPVNILKAEKATLGLDSTLYITLGIKDGKCDKKETSENK